MSPALGNEKGTALPLALIGLVILSGLLATFLFMGGSDPAVSRNLHDSTRARYVADTGIEWAFDQLIAASGQANGWNNLLATNGGQMATNMPLPGLTATSGTFSVTVRNDNQPNDDQITGQPVDPGANDTNNVVILTATGTFNGMTRQIQQVVTHVDLNIPGGLDLPGVGTNTNFSGNAFTISGNDTTLDDKAGACAAVWGIGVADAATETQVESSLSKQQKDNVTGKPQGAGAGQGDNTIAPDLSVTPAQIAKFVAAVKPFADIKLEATGSDQLSYQNIGNTCSTSLNDPNCWGTSPSPSDPSAPLHPKIIYVKGSQDPGQAFYALRLSGDSKGVGILIIEDGDLSITGNFRWEGLIIITGQYVGLRYGGGGSQTTYGAVVVNETANVNSEVEVDASGNAKIIHSCQAINNVRNMRQLFRRTSWREL